MLASFFSSKWQFNVTGSIDQVVVLYVSSLLHIFIAHLAFVYAFHYSNHQKRMR